MEIEFNPSRISQTESTQPAAKRDSTAAAADTASFTASNSLNSQLGNIATVRPEQVAKAKALVGSSKYPPDDVLDRIAILLAIHHLGADTANSPNSSSQSGS